MGEYTIGMCYSCTHHEVSKSLILDVVLLTYRKGAGNMSESIQIPVEYIITTTSDWTVFQITEGGWWTDLQVKCTQGSDRLMSPVQNSQNTIGISKAQFDQSTVVVHAKCNLNIRKEHSQSSIVYLITKGDLQSTAVQILAGTESHTLVNDKKVPNDWRNPLCFPIPARRHLDISKQKEVYQKTVKQPKEEIEAQQESQQHAIVTAFNAMFKETFQKKELAERDIEEIFEYLRSNSKNATRFLDAETCRNLTLQAQTRFWQLPNLKKKVSSEASKTLEEIKKRYDELRKIEGEVSVQTLGLGGITRGEKKVAPKE